MNFSIVLMNEHDPDFESVSGAPGILSFEDYYSRYVTGFEYVKYIRKCTLNPLATEEGVREHTPWHFGMQ